MNASATALDNALAFVGASALGGLRPGCDSGPLLHFVPVSGVRRTHRGRRHRVGRLRGIARLAHRGARMVNDGWPPTS